MVIDKASLLIGMAIGMFCVSFGAYMSYRVQKYRYKRYVARQQIPKV
jgi:hypothetical protein